MPVITELYYSFYGPAMSASPAVVLIHGAGSNRLYWPAEIRRMPGLRVYAIDLPGHGKSSHLSGCQNIGEYAGYLVNWMDAMGLEQVLLIGHSMGSGIALALAIQQPEYVSGVALIGSAARLEVNPELLALASNPQTFPEAVRTIIKWSFSPSASLRLVELASQRMLEGRPDVLYMDLLACNCYDSTESLGKVQSPALLICGEGDKMTPLHRSLHLAGALPAARLEIIPQAGHMVVLEKPKRVAEALGRFAASIVGQAEKERGNVLGN